MCAGVLQHYQYELVIKTLVQHNLFYMLHQFLQYHVLSDSKPLVRPGPALCFGHLQVRGQIFLLCVFEACLLLSLESTYPPAHQLSLDMLKVRSHTHTHTQLGKGVCALTPHLPPASVHSQR